MRCIISGSRNIFDYSLVESAIVASDFIITSLVTDASAGAASLGYRWAYVTKTPITTFKPNWNSVGKAGGHVNNFELAANADVAVIVWDGVCQMTKSLIEYCRRCQVAMYIVQTNVDSLVTQGRAESTNLTSAQSGLLANGACFRRIPTSRLLPLAYMKTRLEQSVGLPFGKPTASGGLASQSPTVDVAHPDQTYDKSSTSPERYTSTPSPTHPSPSSQPSPGP